jgi:hypothetical protein
MTTEAVLTVRSDPLTGPTFEMKAYGLAPGDFRIGLAPISTATWFEAVVADPAPRKDALLASAPADVWGEMDGSRPGQAEALDLVAGWLGVDAPAVGDRPPLLAAARLVEDDLCLMEKRAGGWTLTAASLCSGSFFTPAESVGKALHDLHGPVPGFNDRFLIRVARIFDHLAAESILERRNWSVVNSGALSLPRAEPVRGRISGIRVEDAPTALYVRSERQTIRRLPRTGGVLFTIRIWREVLAQVLADPVRRAAFKAAWAAAMSEPGGAVRDYKSFTTLDRLIGPLLD